MELSEVAARLEGQLIGTPPGPKVLLEAWRSDQLLASDLATLIPAAWLHIDQPEQVIGAEAWVELYRAAGLFVFPRRPELLEVMRRWTSDGDLQLYRGATAQRARGMSWVLAPGFAEPFRVRAERTVGGDTAVFAALVPRASILSIMYKAQDGGGAEYVVDPGELPAHLRRVQR